MEPTKHSSTKNIIIAVILVAILALILMWSKNRIGHTIPENTAATDPETSQVQEQATQNFATTDDTASLETDLNASIGGLAQ